MVVETEHRMDRMVAQRGWREKTLAVFVGILCSGDGLREINHRSFASACRAGHLNRRATGKFALRSDQARNGKHAPISWIPFYP
jgi:hypothetical protein